MGGGGGVTCPHLLSLRTRFAVPEGEASGLYSGAATDRAQEAGGRPADGAPRCFTGNIGAAWRGHLEVGEDQIAADLAEVEAGDADGAGEEARLRHAGGDVDFEEVDLAVLVDDEVRPGEVA